MGEDPLAVTREELREMADRTVDMLADLLADPKSGPALRRATPAEMERRLGGPPPLDGRPYEEVLEQLRDDVLPFMGRCDHPGYFAFIPASGTFPGALGDFIASALNIYAGSWMEAAGPSRVELTVLDWFKDWIGYPQEAAGLLLSGGSAANLTALACAREAIAGGMRDDLVVYASDQAHSSVARAARTLGFRPDQLRVLPADERFCMRADAVEGAISADREAGRVPLVVCASAGSTNTGAIDPLARLAEICREHGAWLHVDAAYGGFAVLTERGKRWLTGIGEADSVTLDPHKWLYQPFECGCVLVREGRLLSDAFQITPDYLKDVAGGPQEVNFSDLGLQLTRMSRALKVWISVNTFGLEAFRTAIDRALDLAREAQARVEASESLELLEPATLGVVCFRRRFGEGRSEAELEDLNRRLVAALDASGEGLVSSTRLRGRYAIRLCVLNHTSGAGDVRRVIEWLEQAPVEAEAGEPRTVPEPGEPDADRHRGIAAGWASGGELTSEALRGMPPFADLPEAQLDELSRAARTTSAEAGERVTSRWGRGRDFYVIIAGHARVDVDGEVARELGPGDFFGELAALDWGAGFGYARLATVVATTPLRLLAVPAETLNRLAREVPAFRERMRRAADDRLATS